eukprot:TRINITY_DN59651_c0_g1_i1.p1 TRINITY_DN59651_c0_g1~~TRINITY_DN59651_c0_g1_i1.p1  ORF type:complete len:642 (+),score=91.07 TRINITY_DN59651_c0_g1_i1:118-2043(+)
MRSIAGSQSGSPPPLRVDAPFPELPSDADMELPSWRTGLHSDWRLNLGGQTYNVHKVLTGHGPRASAFLCSAFTTGQFLATGLLNTCTTGAAADASARSTQAAGENETDLSHILPEPVWPLFEELLDYIYTGELKLHEKNAVPLLRCADALQIRALFHECVKAINDLLSVESAPRMLGDAAALLGGAPSEQILSAAADVIADHFEKYSTEDLLKIPVAQLISILKRDDLSVLHENEVFDCVLHITARLDQQEPDVARPNDLDGASETCMPRASSEAPVEQHPAELEAPVHAPMPPSPAGARDDVSKLWQTVRFGALSSNYIIRAAQIDAIPKTVLILSQTLHRKCGNNAQLGVGAVQEHHVEGWPLGPLRPRKPFKGLTCAILYSVDSEARSDRDVERNMTAAALVAEEIEFLGGRSVLENIFARSPQNKEKPQGGAQICMDKVDVAFVLAPWTPSQACISRLIDFVDQGGGAVLLSFIGGLSRGAWLEGQYEPLITRRADDIPYEDVHLLSASVENLGDSLKRCQDTAAPPKILCGVDCINGRRRITSQIVEGSKVLAKWSDCQPLVVQHPEKNVYSISQRVSRIFELEDEGRDDTLQLVLNVMLRAGREAWKRKGRRPPGLASGRRPSHETVGGLNVSL